MSQLTQHYHSTLAADRRATIGKLDPYLLEEMLHAAGSLDTDFAVDLTQGFPVTGELPACHQGVPVPGGQRVHGKPGLVGPLPIEALQARCARINETTLNKAKANAPKSMSEWQLAEEVWSKVKKDISLGRLGKPMEVDEVARTCSRTRSGFGSAGQQATIKSAS